MVILIYAVENIKASLSESESQGNKYDDRMRDDYIPPNRKMLLLCKQKESRKLRRRMKRLQERRGP